MTLSHLQTQHIYLSFMYFPNMVFLPMSSLTEAWSLYQTSFDLQALFSICGFTSLQVTTPKVMDKPNTRIKLLNNISMYIVTTSKTNFKVGNKVFVKAQFFRTTRPLKKLSEKYLRPYEITAQLSTLLFTFHLPESIHSVHPVFHMSMLSRSLTVDFILFSFFILFYFYFLFLFNFLFLEQLRLGVISHAVTSVTN